MAKLNTTIHVHTDAGTVIYLPGEEVAAEHAKLITAPDVWDEAPAASGDEQSQERPAASTAVSTPAATSQETAGVTPELTEPPRGGKGSADTVWVAYARSLGLEVADGTKKAEIFPLIDALKATATGEKTEGEADSSKPEGADGEPSRDPDEDNVDDWVEYAEKLGIDVPDDADTPDIIALVDAQK